MKRIIAFLVTIAACACCVPQSASARVLELSDLRTIVNVSQPQISPDGKQIVFIKSTDDFKKNKHKSQLMLMDIASGATRPLTYDRTGIDSPRWSPTGDRIAIIGDVTKNDDTESQILVLPMNGGDPLQATDADNGVQEFTWKPDGSAFAYVTADTPANKKQIDKHFDAFEVGDLDYKTEAAPVPSHIWVVSAAGKGARRLTSGSWSLSAVNGGGSPVSWSADGKAIAFEKLPDAVVGDSDTSSVALVDVKTRRVSDLPGQRPYSVGPFFAPVGNALAMLWFPHGAFNSNGYLTVTSSAGGPGTVVGGQQNNVDWFQWTDDGRAIVMAGEHGPLTELWVEPLRGAGHRLDTGDVNFGGDAVVGKDGAIAFVGDTTTQPGELYYFATPGSPIKRLTNYNAAIAKLSLGADREVRWTGPGGYAEDGIVTLPPGYVAGKRYPLALVVHGGPQGSSQLSFDSLTQLIAARGIITFQPNYRGSTNLGDAYQHAIYRDTGVGPGQDAMAGVATLEKMGLVDPARMCVTGWSYGGYMTTWLESHYNVWKCAMAGAALTDWVADYTIAFYQKGDADFFGAGSTPWNDKGWDIWRDQSPIAYAGNVKAPTLIMGDVGDPNVPIYNSYLWYHALRDNGVDVQFYAYPRGTHFPGDPVGAESVTRRWVDWVASHLK